MNLDFPKYLGIGAGKTLRSFIGISTTFRNVVNGETIFNNDANLNSDSFGLDNLAKEGFWLGYDVTTVGAVYYLVSEALNRNYIPIAVLGALNAGHLFFEFGRLGKKRFEKMF